VFVLQGEQGDKGDPGDPGAKGDKGDKGDPGAQGLPGQDCGDWPELQDRLWCLEECPEVRPGSCQWWACDGVARTCTASGSLDGSCGADETCNAAGNCEWNEATCGGLTCPTHPVATFALVGCNAQGHCEYEPRDDPKLGSDPLAAEIYIAPGVFAMGSPATEANRESSEGPVHLVGLGGYFIKKYEVTVERYDACRADNASSCTAPSTADWDGLGWGVNQVANGRKAHPQNGLDWDQARAYCLWVGGGLPSEAQWEYAATGPSHRRYPWGEAAADCNHAVYDGDGGNRPWGCNACVDAGCSGTSPVGSRPAGASWSGALDMSGNVWEWCQDWWHADYTGAPADGTAWESPSGSARVLRGGSFYSPASLLRSAKRLSVTPSSRSANNGVRCSRPAP